MAEIPKIKSTPVSVGGTISLGSAVGPALQEAAIANKLSQLNDEYFERTKRADQTAVYAKNISEATLEYQQLVEQRMSQTVDENGNPTYHTLATDIRKIGDKVSEKYRRTIIDGEVASQFQQNFNNYVVNQQIGALSRARDQQQAFARNTLSESLSTLADSASVAPLEQRDYYTGQAKAIINSSLQSGSISPEHQFKLMDTFQGNVNKNVMSRLIDDNPAEALKLLNSGSIPPGMHPEDIEGYKATAQELLTRRINQEAAFVSKRNKQLNDAVIKVERYLDDGGLVTPAQMQELRDQVVGTPAEDKLNIVVEKQKILSQFTAMNDVTRLRVMDSLRGNLDSPDKISILKKLQTIDKSLREQQSRDPLSFAIRQGVVPELEPLDSNADISEQLANRLEVIQSAEAYYGRVMPAVTEREAADLKNTYNAGTAEDKVQLLENIVSGLDSKSMEVFKMIASKGSTQMGLMGALVRDGQSDTAVSIIRGKDIRTQTPSIIPKPTEFNAEVNELVADYMSEEQRADVVNSIKSVYATLSQEDGDYSGELNSDRLQKAASLVSNGGLIEYNNARVEPPARDMDENDFEDFMDDLTDADIVSLGGIRGLDFDQAAAIRSGRLVSMGFGRYAVMMPVKGRNKAFVKPDGSLFVLDYNRLTQGTPVEDTPPSVTLSPEQQAAVDRLNASLPSLSKFLTEDKPPIGLDFLPALRDAAAKVYGDNAILQKVAMAQAILESNLLNKPSQLAAKNNNFFGIKGRGTAGAATYLTSEFYGGRMVRVRDTFASNALPVDSFLQHKDLLGNGRYAGVMNADSPEEAFIRLQQAGYATDPQYARKLTKVYRRYIEPLFTEERGE